MNPKLLEQLGKGLVAAGVALLGGLTGKYVADREYQPIYETQRKTAKILNTCAKRQKKRE